MLKNTLLKSGHLIEELILLLVLLLTMLGMAITDFSPYKSHLYWTLLIILFSITSIGFGWFKPEYQGKVFKELIIRQLIHWGATLITVSGVYLLLNTGRLNYESAGLVIQLIIGLSLFLDGRNLGWRFSLVGVLIGVTAIIAAYFEEYIWVILIFSLCISVITYYWEKHRQKIFLEKKHEKQ